MTKAEIEHWMALFLWTQLQTERPFISSLEVKALAVLLGSCRLREVQYYAELDNLNGQCPC